MHTGLTRVSRQLHSYSSKTGETSESSRRLRSAPEIRDLLRLPRHYFRSVHLERDFQDANSLDRYVVTASIASAVSRVVEGLQPTSGRRAWRITGDYGSGKSSFALLLAHLLSDSRSSTLRRIRKSLDFHGAPSLDTRLVPILITGSRETLVPAIARAINTSLQRTLGPGRRSKAVSRLLILADQTARGGGPRALLELLQSVSAYSVDAGYSGVLLVADEMGKFLEYSALHPEEEDVFTLQSVAEAAARSGDQPLVVLGLLHQGFHAYSARLPSSIRHEWEKVADRFDEVVFDQPLAHTARLVAGALHVDSRRIPDNVVLHGRSIARSVRATGWFRTADSITRSPDSGRRGRAAPDGESFALPLAIYPVHPTLLPVLIRFFARFGQHERSLFSFLLSSDPFSLQQFAVRRVTPRGWYRLCDFYDYVRATFGHRLSGASYRSQWLRISGVVEAGTDLSALELSVLKTVAVLNLVDADDLLPLDAVLTAAVGDGDEAAVSAAVRSLVARGLLYRRGSSGGYRLWPATSVSLESAFRSARRALGPVENVAPYLSEYLERRPLLARRHLIATGTLRYFEVRYCSVGLLREVASRPTDADGLLVVVLCDSRHDCDSALGIAQSDAGLNRAELLIAVTPPLRGMTPEIQDARCWSWVANNTPELTHDELAAAEVARQLAMARRAVAARLAQLTGLRIGHVYPSSELNEGMSWLHCGRPTRLARGRGFLSWLSDICDALYPLAPRIRNELLNRKVLSSPAAAARMRLVEKMFTSSDQAVLGIDASKAPPEKSMYLSVLRAGNVHRMQDDCYVIGEPPEDNDPLCLRPALQELVRLLEGANGQRVSVAKLMDTLRQRPYGVRAGVAPLLLAILATSRAHELAAYENGTFLRRFGPPEFLRLTKLPTTFEFQLCRVSGVRLSVFNRLADVFASARAHNHGVQLLDVVTPLCVFAAQLPEYTRHCAALSDHAVAVREALLGAREPAPLLFRDLPAACGVGEFTADEPADSIRVHRFITLLRAALDELRAALPQLLHRLGVHLTQAVGEPSAPNGLPADRYHLADRSRRVVLGAREPRLRAFANRLGDSVLEFDAWAEAMASFAVSKPPIRWGPQDEARAIDEMDVLAATFRRVEAITFSAEHALNDTRSALRVGLTRGDGIEVVRIVHTRREDEGVLDRTVEQLRTLLPPSLHLRIAALSRLLWSDLDPEMTTAQQGALSELAVPPTKPSR